MCIAGIVLATACVGGNTALADNGNLTLEVRYERHTLTQTK